MGGKIRQHEATEGEKICLCLHEVKFHTSKGCCLTWCTCKIPREVLNNTPAATMGANK